MAWDPIGTLPEHFMAHAAMGVGGAVTDHGALTGLGDDDHTQYVHTSIARTVSVGHTYSAEQTFNGGVDVGTSGRFDSQIADGAGPMFFFQATNSHTSPSYTNALFALNDSGGTRKMAVTQDGVLAVGPNALNAGTEGLLNFTDQPGEVSAGSGYWGVSGFMNHTSVTITPSSPFGGVSGGCGLATSATVPSSAFVAGGLSIPSCRLDSASLGTKELAGYIVRPGGQSPLTNALDQTVEQKSVSGNWGRVSSFRAVWWLNPGKMIAQPTNEPAIVTGATLAIPGSSATSGDQFGLEILAPDNERADTPTNGAGIKTAFPQRGTNRAHIFFGDADEPNTMGGYAAVAGGPNSVLGGVYFDDGTNNTAGLYEHDGTNWLKLHALPNAPPVYTPTNVVTDRAYDANATNTNELADVLGTLIADLQAQGVLA